MSDRFGIEAPNEKALSLRAKLGHKIEGDIATPMKAFFAPTFKGPHMDNGFSVNSVVEVVMLAIAVVCAFGGVWNRIRLNKGVGGELLKSGGHRRLV
jgi:hypothetical protein